MTADELVDAEVGTVRTLSAPTPKEALAHVEAAIDRGDLVAIFGRCTVEYDGRATSYLGPGDRHVMLKPDGAALVHTATGREPVNWQPPGCVHDPRLRDGILEIVSRRSTPDEVLHIRFERVIHAVAFTTDDAGELQLAGTEGDLRRRILEEPDLLEPGFRPLAVERETSAGAIDIFGKDTDGAVVAVELKRRRVGPDAVGQLRRYVDALQRDLHANAEVRGILVAPSVTDRAEQLLAAEGLEFVALAPESELDAVRD